MSTIKILGIIAEVRRVSKIGDPYDLVSAGEAEGRRMCVVVKEKIPPCDPLGAEAEEMGEDIDNWDEGGIRSLGRGDSRKGRIDASVRCVRGAVGRTRKQGTLEDIGAWGE